MGLDPEELVSRQDYGYAYGSETQIDSSISGEGAALN